MVPYVICQLQCVCGNELEKKLFKRCLVLLLFAWFVSQGTQNDQQYSNPFHLPEKNNQGLSRNVPEITQFLSHKKVNQM